MFFEYDLNIVFYDFFFINLLLILMFSKYYSSKTFIKGLFIQNYMAKARKFVAYRRLERPYTRVYKYKKKSFVKVNPSKKIVKFDMGNMQKKFQYSLFLISKDDLQIRDGAIEAGRQSSVRFMEKLVGKNDFFMKVRIYPHHILRENPLAAGAGADRMSTGMAAPFGKVIGCAARVFKGQAICQLDVNKQNLDVAKKALKRFGYKLPCSFSIEVVENKI